MSTPRFLPFLPNTKVCILNLQAVETALGNLKLALRFNEGLCLIIVRNRRHDCNLILTSIGARVSVRVLVVAETTLADLAEGV